MKTVSTYLKRYKKVRDKIPYQDAYAERVAAYTYAFLSAYLILNFAVLKIDE